MLAFALIGPYILDYSQSFFSLFLHEIGGGVAIYRSKFSGVVKIHAKFRGRTIYKVVLCTRTYGSFIENL